MYERRTLFMFLRLIMQLNVGWSIDAILGMLSNTMHNSQRTKYNRKITQFEN